MDSTTPGREKAAAIRQVRPARKPLSRPPDAPPARSAGWAFVVFLAYLLGAAALAGGLYVYFR